MALLEVQTAWPTPEPVQNSQGRFKTGPVELADSTGCHNQNLNPVFDKTPVLGEPLLMSHPEFGIPH